MVIGQDFYKHHTILVNEVFPAGRFIDLTIYIDIFGKRFQRFTIIINESRFIHTNKWLNAFQFNDFAKLNQHNNDRHICFQKNIRIVNIRKMIKYYIRFNR